MLMHPESTTCGSLQAFVRMLSTSAIQLVNWVRLDPIKAEICWVKTSSV